MKKLNSNKAVSFKFESKRTKTKDKKGTTKIKQSIKVDFEYEVCAKKNYSFVLKLIVKLLGMIIVRVIMNGSLYISIILGNRNDFFIKRSLKWIY